MRPVRPGDRGPAVEDIQRRLLRLGFELGPTGVDGVYLGKTTEAVRSFQATHAIGANGLVDSQTWAALVDATFLLGDRMLYLRLPYFHGCDVTALQGALNALGFACGASDGIFGPFTESGLREFQRNAGLPADGIMGPDTSRSLFALRHVWEGKEGRAHSAARLSPARAAEVLARANIAVSGLDVRGESIAGRIVNLALATSPDSLVTLLPRGVAAPSSELLVLRICGNGTASATPGRPVVRVSDADTLAAKLITAVSAAKTACSDAVIELDPDGLEGERDEQRAAVMLLDAICLAFD